MIERPDLLTNRPGSAPADAPDPVSEHLDAVHLAGGIFFHAELSAPFCLEFPSCEHVGQMLRLGTRRVVPFHVVTAGVAEARLGGADPFPLEGGDVVVFLHDGSYVMASPGANGPVPIAPLLPPPPYDGVLPVRCGGGGEITEVICGFLYYERTTFNPLLDLLPRVVRVSRKTGDGPDRLSHILRLIDDEVGERRPGSHSLLSRLAELLFVEVLRDYLTTRSADPPGWSGALQDPFVAKILGLFHSRPDRRWDLETLAREVSLSRSALVRRFTRALGQPPMRYLTRLRIQRATDLLRTTDLTVSGVATRVGYGSEETFNRAFRRTMGRPPGEWRRRPTRLPPLPPAPSSS